MIEYHILRARVPLPWPVVRVRHNLHLHRAKGPLQLRVFRWRGGERRGDLHYWGRRELQERPRC